MELAWVAERVVTAAPSAARGGGLLCSWWRNNSSHPSFSDRIRGAPDEKRRGGEGEEGERA